MGSWVARVREVEDRIVEERIIEPQRLLPPNLPSILLFTGIWRNAELISSLTRREIAARYRGSWLGLLWPVLEPLLLLAVYTFIFSVVFGARWPGIYESDVIGYATVVFSGLVTFNIFSESVRACPKLILANRNFVQRVVFPLEVLPVVQVGSALFNAITGFLVLLVFLLGSGAPLTWTALWIPVVWVGFAVFSLGIAYAVAAASVFVRDLEPLIAIAITALFFGSAIFYPLERLPDAIQELVRLVPTAAAVDLTRSLLLLGKAPDAFHLLGPGAVSIVTLFVGYGYFMKVKGSFADAL